MRGGERGRGELVREFEFRGRQRGVEEETEGKGGLRVGQSGVGG